MRPKQFLAAISAVAAMALIGVLTPSVSVVTADEVKLDKDHLAPDIKKVFPEKALPAGEKFYEGRVRNILSRKETFGFSVRDNRIPSEFAFYVLNTEANRTIIETVLFAAKENRAVRIYYDDKTYVADAVETWGW